MKHKITEVINTQSHIHKLFFHQNGDYSNAHMVKMWYTKLVSGKIDLDGPIKTDYFKLHEVYSKEVEPLHVKKYVLKTDMSLEQ